MTHITHSPLDRALVSADIALRTLFAKPHATRPTPKAAAPTTTTAASASMPNAPDAPELSAAQKRHAAGLMRVNHVGEVCAQALYAAQALMATSPAQRAQLEHAASEEVDHLAWCHERLRELDSHPSWLNPLWYGGAFGLGLIAGAISDRTSLGFLVETEAQVHAHLASHLEHSAAALPAQDAASRAIVWQMQQDEAQHGAMAQAAGAQELAPVVKRLMAMAARVMTRTAYWV